MAKGTAAFVLIVPLFLSCCCLLFPLPPCPTSRAQMMSNASYSQAARGIAVALQAYAAQRHPYARAADEIELAVHTARASAAAAAAATAGRGVQHQTRKEEL